MFIIEVLEGGVWVKTNWTNQIVLIDGTPKSGPIIPVTWEQAEQCLKIAKHNWPSATFRIMEA